MQPQPNALLLADARLSYDMLNNFSLFVQFFAAKTIPNFVFEHYMDYLCKQFQLHAEGVIEAQNMIKAELDSGKDIYDIDGITRAVGVAKTVIINVPPAHTKSTIFSQLSVAWLYAKNPSYAIALISNGSALAQKNGRLAKAVIDNDYYRRLFPYVGFESDNSGRKLLQKVDGFERQGELFMGGIGSAVTGNHFDFILLDDPNKASDNFSAADRRAVNYYIGGTLRTRLRDGACIFLIQQRICKTDATDYLLSVSSNCKHIKLPDTMVGKVKPLPEIASKLYKANQYGDFVLSLRVPTKTRLDAKSDGTYESQFQQAPSNAQQDLFIFNFDAEKHFVATEYNPRLDVYVGVDFNTENNTPILVQTDCLTFFNVIGEIDSPTGGVPMLCENIRKGLLARNIPISRCYFCPDATGSAKRAETNTSAIAALQDGLGLHKSQILHGNYNTFYIKFNLNLSMSSRLVNRLFASSLSVKIDPSCTGLQWDFDNIVTVPTADGGVTTNKDHVSGSPYHCNRLDSFQYAVQRLFFKEDVRRSQNQRIPALDLNLK